ncbi:hypothetical protein [Bacillus sp. RO1]|uniref:hypothetical protein n=1 Tax=Bacillus sp. RO1 TaxID=2722703 RepID=UPI0014570227|nr:hypothetical protein [Bacillus sp. RO1]NLP50259.1 hypothetical protein [Bacillus sp. RO1]
MEEKEKNHKEENEQNLQKPSKKYTFSFHPSLDEQTAAELAEELVDHTIKKAISKRKGLGL